MSLRSAARRARGRPDCARSPDTGPLPPATSLRAWGAGGPLSADAEVAGDEHPLHLAGALADLEDLRVAVEAAHRELVHEAVAAVHLGGVAGVEIGRASCRERV